MAAQSSFSLERKKNLPLIVNPHQTATKMSRQLRTQRQKIVVPCRSQYLLIGTQTATFLHRTWKHCRCAWPAYMPQHRHTHTQTPWDVHTFANGGMFGVCSFPYSPAIACQVVRKRSGSSVAEANQVGTVKRHSISVLAHEIPTLCVAQKLTFVLRTRAIYARGSSDNHATTSYKRPSVSISIAQRTMCEW